ncbi:MAG TPA: helix-hairpin-helix domain-containing protein [Pyrinomonadaceae bacterium]|nr:helix-hairpin-helix domain-containing protein [Pyrinomonadaceae bacterium]
MRRRRPDERARPFFSLFLLVCALPVASCVKLARRHAGAAAQTPPPVVRTEDASAPRVNINVASTAELEKLPGVGRGLAARIVAHRAEYGRFRRPEHLMMVRGISDRRFRAVRALVTTE